MTKSKTPVIDLETDEDGWIGGASQSIYAPKPATHASPPPASKQANKPSPKTPARKSASPASEARSRSLLERMDMAQNLTTPPPSTSKPRNADADSSQNSEASPSDGPSTSPFRTTPSQGIRRPGAKLPSPLPLTSPARNNELHSPSNTRTPLSASHSIPETPLKLSQRGGPQTPATPHYPIYPHSSQYHQDGDAARASGLGLGLTPLRTPIPLAQSPDGVKSPLSEALNLRGRAASASNASIGSPLRQGRSDLHGEPLALNSSNKSGGAGAGHGQIDAMLDRLRNTRSGLGTSASMWAPKPANDSSSWSSSSTTSHTIGSGFSSSNMLGVQTGLDRKRPSHRPNGLQLSLGQGISVMQELEEKAEDDYASSHLSSASVAETFRIDPPAEHDEDRAGTMVPPTPSLGCDSPPSSSEEANGPSRGLDAFGWGKPSNGNGKSSFFSNLPSSSTLEANWSGDDDDEKKNDMEVFQGMHRAAKASTKDKKGSGSSSNYAPLPPPPPINYKAQTPSAPTSKAGESVSPASARSHQPLPSDADSDGDDADVENDRPRPKREGKKADEVGSNSSGLQVASAGGLEPKRSLKRDKSERIRGRGASQSKDKDVDRVKVGLPTSGFAKKEREKEREREDELANEVGKVSLEEKSTESAPTPVKAVPNRIETQQQQTPVAQRVQSIPTVKDDLFSSPAEPKVGLPSGKVAPEAEEVEEKGEKKEEEEEEEEAVGGKTPDPGHAKSMSFDWAADDDELDDELPDLDDWGVTLTPAKPAIKKEETRAEKGKKEEKEGVWRRGGGKGKPEKPAGGKGDSLGIRIAGRAKEASLSPEPEFESQKKAAGKNQPPLPPASTPYGRWNRNNPPTASKDDEVRFKGSGARKAPPPSSASAGRPRPDLGSLAKLLAPEPAGGGGGGKPEARSRKSSPALDKGHEWGKGAPTGAGSVKDSIHAPPSVADSMHAPKNRTPIPTGPKAGVGNNRKKPPHSRK